MSRESSLLGLLASLHWGLFSTSLFFKTSSSPFFASLRFFSLLLFFSLLTGAEEPNVIGDLVQRTRDHIQSPRRLHDSVVRSERLELVRCRHERQARLSGDALCNLHIVPERFR